MNVARAILHQQQRLGSELQTGLNGKIHDLIAELRSLFAETVPGRVDCFGSMLCFELRENSNLLFYHTIQNGLYVWEGRSCCLSTACTD